MNFPVPGRVKEGGLVLKMVGVGMPQDTIYTTHVQFLKVLSRKVSNYRAPKRNPSFGEEYCRYGLEINTI
jgi:hypothetical protein